MEREIQVERQLQHKIKKRILARVSQMSHRLSRTHIIIIETLVKRNLWVGMMMLSILLRNRILNWITLTRNEI